MNKRVKFDFEIDFTNGGGIREQICKGMVIQS